MCCEENLDTDTAEGLEKVGDVQYGEEAKFREIINYTKWQLVNNGPQKIPGI